MYQEELDGTMIYVVSILKFYMSKILIILLLIILAGLMDRGKKPLQAGEWTIVLKEPNKRKAATNSKQKIVLAQIPFYPNEGYYLSYPMVK